MQKKILINLVIISVVGIILTSLLLFGVQTINAHNSAEENFIARFSDVEERIGLSVAQTEELTATIKEDYITRARALSMIIDLHPDIVYDRGKLIEVAGMLDVDELHIIDGDGILRWGTQPEYYGFDFATTDQTRPFLEIINNNKLELAQDPMPNGAAGLMRQYAAVSLHNQKGIAEIGMVPERYEKALESARIDIVLRDMHIRNTGYIFSVDTETKLINAHPNTELIGTNFPALLSDTGFIEIDGKTVKYKSKLLNKNLLVAVIPVDELYAERAFFTPIFILFTVLVFGLFCLSVNTYIKRTIITGILDTVEILDSISSGNLDVTANVDGNPEFIKLSDGINHMLSGIKTMIDEIAALADDRGRLGAIVATADAGIIVKDRDGFITDWNAGATYILGYKAEEIVGYSTKHYTPDEWHNSIDLIQERLAKGEHIAHLTVMREHKDGRIIYCSASYSPIFDEKGEFSGSVAIFHDVTETKVAERKAQKLGAIASTANAGIVVRDANGIITDWNIGAENILGFSSDEMIGKNMSRCIPDGFDDDYEETIEKIKNIGGGNTAVEVVRKHKDGRLVDCSVSYSAIFDEDGSFSGSVAIFHDISERKMIEKELEETISALWEAVAAAEKASSVKSTFLANMSHEIRTPMNAVIGMSDLLLSENLTPRQHRFVSDIKASGANLLGIINNILDLSKIEAGKLGLIPIDYDFYSLLENIDSIFNFSSQSKNIEYISEKAEDLPQYLFGDDIRLRQVLTNLIGNAVKFTTYGYVKLKVWCDESSLYFDISDTGIGIKFENLNKLFDAFEQLDSGINRAKVGTGLGLSITKSIIEEMNGSISVSSEYGKGSTFHVQVPYVLGDSEKIRSQTEPTDFIIAPDARVLIVDDFDVNLNVAVGLLGLFEVKCDTALSGAEAIEMIKKTNYDIIFMDHMMPEMDGVEATVRIRLMGYDEKKYPVIALTANAVEGVSEMLIDSGMNDFLSKPIDKAKLNELLIKWLPGEKVKARELKVAEERKVDEYDENDIMRQLRGIKLLDIDTGLGLMGNSEKLYRNTLKIVTKRIPELAKSMSDYLDNREIKKFINDVHCTKSSLGTIGAEGLSKQAFELEQKAKAANINYCIHAFPSFYAGLMTLYEKLSDVLGTNPAELPDSTDLPDLEKKLSEVEECINSLDDENALDILQNLMKVDYGTDINDKLRQITKHIELFEFKDAMTVLSGIIVLFDE